MAAHRAWRLYFDRSISSQVLGLSQLEFRATSGGADWTNAGVGSAFASATYPDAFFSPAKAFDNASGEWACPLTNQNNINHWIGWDLGPNPADWKDLAEVMIRARADTPGANTQSPKLFRVEWTDDDPATGRGARWTRDWGVGLITSVWASNEVRVYTRPAKTNQPYWRLYGLSSPQNSGYMAFAEVEFRTSLGGGQAATGGTPIASGSYNLTDHAPSQAYDGITVNNRWASDGIFPAWIGYQKSTGWTVVQAKAWARTESVGEANQAPQYLSLDASADGISWVVVAEWATMPWTQGSTWVMTVPEEDELTIPKLATEVLAGATDTVITVTKLSLEGLVGGRTDMLSVSKLSAEVIEGALPQRITFSKLAAEVVEGALPQRISFSKLAVEVLLLYARPINGPVQII